MDSIDLALLYYLSEDMPLSLEPFKIIGDFLDIEESEVIHRLQCLQSDGRLKRIAPILYHHKTTFKYNALTAWEVSPEQISTLANCLTAFTHVSHVYERATCEQWQYNIYGMMHGKTKEDINHLIDRTVETVGEIPHKVIYTTKEWKKTSPNLRFLLK